MSSEKRTKYIIAAASILLMFMFMMLFVRTKATVLLIFGIIMLNIAFQFIARLIINTICEGVFENGINSSSDYFKTSDFEDRLYNSIGVKKIKKQLPVIDRTNFSLRRHSMQNIIDVGCEIEVEHELGMAASLLGIMLAIPFGEMWLFVIFAVLAVLFDFVVVIIQRYNRPRLITVQLKRRARFFEKMEKEKSSDEKVAENQQVEPIEQTNQSDKDIERPVSGDSEEDEND